MTPAKPLKVALLGCGVVGSQVARILLDSGAEFQARVTEIDRQIQSLLAIEHEVPA